MGQGPATQRPGRRPSNALVKVGAERSRAYAYE